MNALLFILKNLSHNSVLDFSICPLPFLYCDVPLSINNSNNADVSISIYLGTISVLRGKQWNCLHSNSSNCLFISGWFSIIQLAKLEPIRPPTPVINTFIIIKLS